MPCFSCEPSTDVNKAGSDGGRACLTSGRSDVLRAWEQVSCDVPCSDYPSVICVSLPLIASRCTSAANGLLLLRRRQGGGDGGHCIKGAAALASLDNMSG